MGDDDKIAQIFSEGNVGENFLQIAQHSGLSLHAQSPGYEVDAEEGTGTKRANG